MPRRLVVCCDLSRLKMERPAGPAVYASAVLDLLRQGGTVEIVGREGTRSADVILSLDGRFRAGRGQRIVTAVLDLGYLFERRGYRWREWLAQSWRVASAVRRSDHLLAPSAAVRFGLERYLRVKPNRVTVVEAVPRSCFRRPSRQEVEDARLRLGLPVRYFLFVGSRVRRKNLALLGRAWQLAAPALGPDVGLVLAGAGSKGVAGAKDLGFVSLEHLPALITGAVAWVNPSLYEGSSIGALEALACGTPALVAGTGAQPHAVGEAGLILDPHAESQWAEAIVTLARDPAVRGRLGAAALRAAAALREWAPQSDSLLQALLGEAAEER